MAEGISWYHKGISSYSGLTTSMPSPFPGMNPYLENPEFWTEVHHLLISVLAETLNPQLLPKYRAAVEKRIYQITEDGAVLVGITDVTIGQFKQTRLERSQMCPAIGADIHNSSGREAYAQIQDRLTETSITSPCGTICLLTAKILHAVNSHVQTVLSQASAIIKTRVINHAYSTLSYH